MEQRQREDQVWSEGNLDPSGRACRDEEEKRKAALTVQGTKSAGLSRLLLLREVVSPTGWHQVTGGRKGHLVNEGISGQARLRKRYT